MEPIDEMNSITSPNPMTSTSDQALITRALTAHVTDAIAKALLHFDALSGKAERGADWDSTTEADRQHYRARARRELRQEDRLALDCAMHRAKQAAFASLPGSVRLLLTDDGRKQFDLAIEAAIGAREAQLLHGRAEQDERHFERVHDIPSPRAFEVIPGGRRVESAQQSEGLIGGVEYFQSERPLGHPVEAALIHESEQ